MTTQTTTETEVMPRTISEFHYRSHMRNLKGATNEAQRTDYIAAVQRFEGQVYADRLRKDYAEWEQGKAQRIRELVQP